MLKKVTLVATVDGDGARVRPIRYALIVDNTLLFVTSSKTKAFTK